MWTYHQASGELDTPTGYEAARGYSGNGAGLNNPEAQDREGVGPIPRGLYTIGAFFDDPGGKGPVVAHLTPDPTNQMFGRSGFMIHGDNAAMNYTASEGCIILSRIVREFIAQSGDARLEVV